MTIGASLKLSHVATMFKSMIWSNIMNERLSDRNNFGLTFLVLHEYVLIPINTMLLKPKPETRSMSDGAIAKHQ